MSSGRGAGLSQLLDDSKVGPPSALASFLLSALSSFLSFSSIISFFLSFKSPLFLPSQSLSAPSPFDLPCPRGVRLLRSAPHDVHLGHFLSLFFILFLNLIFNLNLFRPSRTCALRGFSLLSMIFRSCVLNRTN